MTQLAGKIALVTGAGRGIGAAVARAYAVQGATVYCVARTPEQIRGVAANIVAAGGAAHAVQADIADGNSLADLYARVAEESGGLDILFANAGMSGMRDVTVLSPEFDVVKWRRIIEVNMFGTYDSIRLAVPLMLGRGARIIVVGSGAGHFPIAGLSAYAASKGGLWMLVRTLAEELLAEGISVNELVPGPVATKLLSSAHAERKDAGTIIAREWLKTPEEVVPLALFLAGQPDGLGPTGQSFRLTRRPL